MEDPKPREYLNLTQSPLKPSRRSTTFHSSASQPAPARKRKSGSLGRDCDSSSEELDEKDDGGISMESGKRTKRSKEEKGLSKGEPVNALWKEEAGKGDIKSISKDEVEFVVPQYWLQSSCLQFRKLFEEGSLDPMDSVVGVIRSFEASEPCPIAHIDTSSTILSDYLSLASHQPNTLPLDRLKQVYTFSKSLDSPPVIQGISLAIHSRLARSNPWAAFLLSADIGDIQAAKACLRQMAYDKRYRNLDLKDVYPGTMKGLNTEWICGLVRCLSIHPHDDLHETLGVRVKKWDLISEGFQL